MKRWQTFSQYHLDLFRFCARRMRENNLAAMTAALSFRTIFTLVPVLALALLVLKSLGTLEDGKASLRHILTASGFSQIAVMQDGEAPATQPAGEAAPPRVINVAEEIEALVTRVESKLTFQRIGPVGAVLLIWTALGLLTTIERSLNRIFRAPRDRSLTRRVLLYWSALTLVPVVLAAVNYLGRASTAAVQPVPVLAWIVSGAGWLAEFLIAVLLLAAVYALLPNTRVGFHWAGIGALLAVPLWYLARWGFALYVEHLVLKGNLYGVLGVLPLFLLWVNYCWLIFLAGAELTYTAANLPALRQARSAEAVVVGPSDALAAALAVARPYLAGQPPAGFEDVVATLGLPRDSVHGLLDRLAAAGFVCTVRSGAQMRYLPMRAPARLPVLEVLAVVDPRQAPGAARETDAAVGAAVQRVQSLSSTALAGLTLADLLAGSTAAARAASTAPSLAEPRA